jgi:hypothetical protein
MTVDARKDNAAWPSALSQATGAPVGRPCRVVHLRLDRYLPVGVVAVALLAGACGRQPTWTYQGQLHDAVAEADRVVVCDGGFRYDGDTDDHAVLFEVTNPGETEELRENLEFESRQVRSVCPCLGYPAVDWYRGNRRIAHTSIQHGRAVRWEGFQADARLTEKSTAWLVQWLAGHEVDEGKMMLE